MTKRRFGESCDGYRYWVSEYGRLQDFCVEKYAGVVVGASSSGSCTHESCSRLGSSHSARTKFRFLLFRTQDNPGNLCWLNVVGLSILICVWIMLRMPRKSSFLPLILTFETKPKAKTCMCWKHRQESMEEMARCIYMQCSTFPGWSKRYFKGQNPIRLIGQIVLLPPKTCTALST
jgi:hypothetical protein